MTPLFRSPIRGTALALALASSLGAMLPAWGAAPTSLSLDQGWQVRLLPGQAEARQHPKAAKWLPAQVPGTVQTDLLKAGLVADPFVGDNEAQIQWVGLTDWQYRSEFDADAGLLARGHVELVFEGLDTYAEVSLNGHKLLSADNMHRRWQADIKPLLKPGRNVLEVVFQSPIKRLQPWLAKQPYALPGEFDSAFGDEPVGQQTANYIRKANYGYGWDWGPRVVTAGIWKDVRLQAWDDVRADTLHIAQQRLDANAAQLEAQLEVRASRAEPVQLTLEILDPDGRSLVKSSQERVVDPGSNRIDLPLRIAQPRRWFPAGYGAQDRYTFKVSLRSQAGDEQQLQQVVGLRTVELRREHDQWGRGMALVVNGIPVFAKGANLIPLDSFPSRVDEARMRQTLQDARDANMNMLRMWGGGHYQDDRFYALADELGIMIWQDFMFGGAIPPYDVAFRENTRQEAIEQVKRLRDHASIVLWSGNNEVQTGWEHWGDRIKFKQGLDPEERTRIERGMDNLFGSVLRQAVAEYDPDVPYWASSPSTDQDRDSDREDDGDMHYWKVWGGDALPVTEYLKVTPRFMSEYGLQSFPELRTIAAFAKPDQMQPESTVMRAHQKFDKGNGNQRVLKYIRREFGEPKDFASFVYLSQIMQAEGIALAAEHLRASRPQSMGSLYWQLNDVWPGASWSSVDYFGRWKALHYQARHFYAPELIAALRADGKTSLTLVSDRTSALPAHWRLRLLDVDGKPLDQREETVALPPLSATHVGDFSDAELLKGADPKRTVAVFELLDGNNALLSRQVVRFAPAKDLALPQPQIRSELVRDGDGYALTLTSAVYAHAVWVGFGDLDARLSDNAFDLLPGEPLKVQVSSPASLEALRAALQLRDVASTLAGAPAEPAQAP